MHSIKSGLLLTAATLGVVSAASIPSDGIQSQSLGKRGLAKSAKVTSNGCTYNVPGVGSFTEVLDLDFTKLKTVPSSLTVSTDTIAAGTAPFARRFMPKNVAVNSGGYLTLTVPGNQVSDPILSAEVQSAAKDVLYASVRTVAMASKVPGTTHGFTFYSNDTQEADIAFLTTDNTLLHLTNEQTSYVNPVSTFEVSAPSDATTGWHEYRMDWVPGKTMFYVDGEFIFQITANVPSAPGFLLWNNWSNGNGWAKGPPQNTNTVKIQSITAYYNRTSVKTSPSSASCKAASAKWVQNTQSCTALSKVGPIYADYSDFQYEVKCGTDLTGGVGDLSKTVLPSFSQCINACTKLEGCTAIKFDGGNGQGDCFFKNITAGNVTTGANAGADIAYLANVNETAWDATPAS